MNFPTNLEDWVEWTKRWWGAVAPIPRDQNPVLDVNGNNFMNFNQPYLNEGVVFLFGNRGGSDIRNISVTNGTVFFFPYVNYIATASTIGGGNVSTIGGGNTGASNFISLEDEARIDIDNCTSNVSYSGGITEWGRRWVSTPLFNLDWIAPPAFGSSTSQQGQIQTVPGVSDGVWAFTNELNGKAGDRLSIAISSSHQDIFQKEESATNGRARRHQWNSTITYNISIR